MGGNRDGLNFEQVGNLAIPLPSETSKQERIADFLDAELASVDALVGAKMRQIALLHERREAIVASRVSELCNDHGSVPLRRIWLGIEQGWSPQCDDAEADRDNWAVLRTSAVSSGRFDPLAHKRLPVDVQPDLRYVINDGDLLLTRGSGSAAMVGVAAVADTDGRRLLLSDLLYRVRLQPGWPSGLVASVIGSRPAREQISLLLRGQSGQTIKLRGQDVGEILIPCVPPDRRGAIAAEIAVTSTSHVSAARKIENSLALLHERRRALITAAVTGRLDLPAAWEAVA